MCWKRGQIIAVHEDGVCKEPPSLSSKSVFLHIPGVPASAVKRYLMHELNSIDGEDSPIARAVGRRRFRVDWTILPPAVIAQLQQSREYTINNIAAAKSYIRDSLTGLLEG